MEAQQILTLFTSTKNGILILTLIGLVVAENLIEKDFVCPCTMGFKILFFFFYLLLPAFIIFTVTFCIMCELEKQKAAGNQDQEAPENRGNEAQEAPENRGNQNQEAPENRGNQNQEAPKNLLKCKIIFQCSIPSIFWVLLFFSDGRYVACLRTNLKDRFFDSSSQLPWEWCHQNQTLTPEQKGAEEAYIWSKVGGFLALVLASALILMCKCRTEYKACNQQNPGEDGPQPPQNPREHGPQPPQNPREHGPQPSQDPGEDETQPSQDPGEDGTGTQNRMSAQSESSESTPLMPGNIHKKYTQERKHAEHQV